MNDIRTQTTLLCGTLALAIALSTLLRVRVRTAQLLFAGFAGDIGFWYLSQSAFFGLYKATAVKTAIVILAIALPQFALHLFEAVVPHKDGARPPLLRLATLLLAV